jgi:hypothetical protein
LEVSSGHNTSEELVNTGIRGSDRLAKEQQNELLK